jgi:hypothetical protein
VKPNSSEGGCTAHGAYSVAQNVTVVDNSRVWRLPLWRDSNPRIVPTTIPVLIKTGAITYKYLKLLGTELFPCNLHTQTLPVAGDGNLHSPDYDTVTVPRF